MAVTATPRRLEERQEASCATCSKDWTGANALSIAARHNRSTGHEVYVNVSTTLVYEGR